MPNETLPEGLGGDWIWLPAEERKDNLRAFARKEFVLESSVSFSELWVSAIPFYHVYINGEHVGYGPASPTRSNCYVDRYDVTQYLDVGLNTLALIAVDQIPASYSWHPYPPKMWCQLNVEGTPLVCTGPDWKIAEATCYAYGQPRCHAGMGETEKVNLDSFLSDWLLTGFDDSEWDDPKILSPFLGSFPVPALSGLEPFLWVESEAVEPTSFGRYTDKNASAFYFYSSIPEFIPGNYAAQSYAFSLADIDVTMLISSDDPFAIFCNDDPVMFCLQTRELDKFETPHSPRVGREILLEAKLHLKKGWNRFLCFQDASESSMGLMLLFPDVKKGALTFRREASNVSLTGWNLCGPLRIPLPFSSPSFQMDGREDAIGLLPLEEHINDISSFLGNCEFVPDPVLPVGSRLKAGEYVIYDLGGFCYGFPLLDISGSRGDVIDITCGFRFSDSAVRSIGPLGRMTDTIILRDGNNSWMRLSPRGARYVMLSVRKASGSVEPVFRYVSAASDLGTETDCQCSDETFAAIWSKAIASLRNCANQNIIDDPCGRRCQTLPEAYVYARLLYSVFGGNAIAVKALEEFADGQLENGMLLRISPSGVYSYSPDTALLWILWLETHWKFTGDEEFLRKMIPTLDMLLRFFRMIAPSGEVLLTAERAGHCTFLNEMRDMEEKGIFTPLNALYYRALIVASDLYAQADEKDRGVECYHLAEKVAKELLDLVVDHKSGLYADFYQDGKRAEKYSFRTHLVLLNSGIIHIPKEANQIFEYCFNDMDTLLPFSSSPFFFFILETLFSFNKQGFAFSLMQRAYEYNLEREDLYEFGVNPHVFNIVAADFMVRELLGIRASAPGLSQIYFNPACSVLSYAKGKFPSASGRIGVEWHVENRDLTVSIDSNHQLDVLPVIPPKYGSTFNLGNYVNLLDPSSGN